METDVECLIKLVLTIFKDDIEPLLDLDNFAAFYEDRINIVHPTQGLSIKRPNNWSDLLLIASQLPIDDAFSQLLHCIRNSPDTGAAIAEEDWLHLLHLDNQRDLPRLQRLQFALPAALPAAMRSDEFVQCLQEVNGSSGFDGDGDAEADVHCVLRELIKSSPDWFEDIILAALIADENCPNGANLLSMVAPFGAEFKSEIPNLREQLNNTVDSSEFENARRTVIGHSNRWFCRNGLKFNPDTCGLEPTANQESPSPPESPVLSSTELRGRQLRDYQLELAEPALLGHNSIVIAPTGSGKTLVAVYVTLKLLEAEPEAKVAFLASTTHLVQQQYQEFRSVLPQRWRDRVCQIHGGSDAKDRMPFAQALRRHSVLVLSTQILVNALNREPASFDDLGVSAFRLIVFDECHNCLKGHPTKEVMMHYMQRKRILDQLDPDPSQRVRLPQILGLTASPGTGKASRPEDANEHLIRLCANLDCPYPISVQRCLASLEKVTSNPNCQIHSVPGKPTSGDIFVKLLNQLMDISEDLLSGYRDTLQQWECEGMPLSSVPPRGTPAYIGYCANIKYNMHNVTDEATRKNLLACGRYLGSCNEAQMIAQYFRSVDALGYLRKELRAQDEMAKPPASEAEERLRRYLDGLIGQLIRFCDSQEALTSPPLDKLVEILREQFNSQSNSRAIIFVQQKFYARVLADFLNETGGLGLGLAATYVTGATSGEASGGTNAGEQQARLKDFKRGRYKVIACTSVTEEGLDIPDCNLVVRFCYVTNEVSMVQTKGRGRAIDSAYHVIVAETQEWLRQKERTNQERDAMMRQAVLSITSGLSPKELEVKMLEYQASMLNDDEEDKGASGGNGNGTRSNVPDSDHDILCGKCQTQLSHSTRLRLIGDIHRIVVDVDLFAGGRLRGQSSGEVKKVPGMEMIGVDLVCDSCGFKVAKIVRYGRLYFPLLAVEYVMFRRSITKEMERVARKWKATDFLQPVPSLSQDDKSMWRRLVPRLPEQYSAHLN